MSFTVPVAMFGYLPACVALFSMLPVRRAILACLLLGWLFLPMASYSLAGLPDYSKFTAVSGGLLLGVLLFDANSLVKFRPQWFDIPMLIWCVVPMASSLSNGLGVWDGLSSTFGHVSTWGIPYLIGRIYFRDREGIWAMAMAIFVGGLIYIPFCLYEVRMAPVLHHHVYGYHQHSFAQVRRLGGFRPMVFLQHGLAVGMWMTAASVAGFWLWRSGKLKQLWGMPAVWLLVGLLVTTVLCKSFGSLLLLAGGIAVLFACRWMRSPLPLLLVLLIIPGYLIGRVVFDYRAEMVVDAIAQINEVRASSLEGRIRADAILLDRAMDRPLFGWGGWNRFRDQAVLPDTLWAITVGQRGLIGLISVYTAMLLPPGILLYRMVRRRIDPAREPAAVAVATIILLFLLDCFSNAMLNPVFFAAAGGLAGYAPQVARVGAHRRMVRAGSLPTASGRSTATSAP